MKLFNTTLIAAAALGMVSAAHAELKVATVDVQQVFKDYYKTHEAQKELDNVKKDVEAENASRLEKVQAIEKELQDMKKRAEDPSLSDKAKKDLAEQFQLKQNEGIALEKSRREFVERKTRSLNESMTMKTRAIVEDIDKVTSAKATAGKFDLVLDKSATGLSQTKVFLHTNPSMDITDAVKKELNASAPAGFDPSKAAVDLQVPAAAPAAPAK